MLFKATLPLIAVLGILSYGLYMRGGDPAATWQSVGSGISEQLSSSFSGAQQSASTLLTRAKRGTGDVNDVLFPSESEPTSARRVQVYSWKDSSGVTHFSSEEPVSVDSVRTVTVNPDANVLAPVQATSSAKQASIANVESQSGALQQGEPLPGIAGHILSRQDTDKEAENRMSPTHLIKLLQPTEH